MNNVVTTLTNGNSMMVRTADPNSGCVQLGYLLTRLFALVVFVGACQPSAFEAPHGEVEGLPAANLAQLSAITNWTRSTFPKLSAQQLTYKPSKLMPNARPPKPELALVGQGLSLQTNKGQSTIAIEMSLYLEKQHYAEGYVVLRKEGRSGSERWPIIAYSLRGEANGQFAFTYLLHPPNQTPRYLVLIGGAYYANGSAYKAFEGTLITPGKGQDLKQWAQVFRINFGYRFPVTPSHQQHLGELKAQYKKVETDFATVHDLEQEIAIERAKIAKESVKLTSSEKIEVEPKLLAAQQSLWQRLDQFLQAYLQMRAQLHIDYAAFVKSNRYLWLSAIDKGKHYSQFEAIAKKDSAIEKMVKIVSTRVKNNRLLNQNRSALINVIRQYKAVLKKPLPPHK